MQQLQTLTYEQYLAYMRGHWQLGQHISLIAPTGGGKSWIARDLLTMKKYSVAVATKSKDKTLDLYVKEDGFLRRESWSPDWTDRHILLWKTAKELGNFRDQQVLVYYVMNDLYKRGGYVLYFDDLYYIANTLRLKQAVQMLYTQVRSNGVSIIASMQRPQWNPLEAVSQASFIIVMHIRDRHDIQRIAEGVGLDARDLQVLIRSLADREFLLLQSNKEPIHVQKRNM